MESASIFENTVTQDEAAQLLITSSALIELSLDDARSVVQYMQPKRIPEGVVFMREGEKTNTNYMLLVLHGDVSVETHTPGDQVGMVVSIIGPGNLIGEMGILDGAPRSATCTAASDLAVAVLSRAALFKLIQEKPQTAAHLTLAISKRLADRLRETNQKLKLFSKINNALQQEINAIMDSRGKGA